MKLALIRQHYNPYGGAERFVDSSLAALLENNVDVSLYSRDWHPTKQTLLSPVACNPHYVGSASRDRGFARSVCAAIAREKPDLVQAHECIACCDIYRAGDGVHRLWLEQQRQHLGRWGRIALALNPHHRYVLQAEAKLFQSPRLKAVICNSPMVREELKACYGLPDALLHVIYSAVDGARFGPHLRSHRTAVREALHIGEDAVVFLFLGSDYSRRGLRYAIAALATLPEHAHLLVVGHDRRLASYGKLARAQGLEKRVHLLGSQRQPEPFYGAADAFVLPTLYDPLPNAALEAMACGLPVVTSTRCGAAERVSEHGAGLVCAAEDVVALATHLRTLMDPAAREAMGTGAREAVRGLTPDAMSRQLLLLYHHLLGTGVGSSSGRAAADSAHTDSAQAAAL